jgi:hypothetical protein
METQIIQRIDGKYLCIVQIQDGTDQWDEDTEDAARKAVKLAEKVLNGNKIKKKDISLYREERVLQPGIRLVKVP